jgi:hypothetical protein
LPEAVLRSVSETFQMITAAGSSRNASAMSVLARLATKVTYSCTGAELLMTVGGLPDTRTGLIVCAVVPVSPPPRSRIAPTGGGEQHHRYGGVRRLDLHLDPQ